MEADLTESKWLLTLWVWADKNKKQLIGAVIVLVVVGLGVAFWLAHKNETQNDANAALSKLVSQSTLPGGTPATADSLLKVTADYSGTDAAQRALLLAAADLFTSGKYDEASAQFQKFIKDYGNSKLVSQAAMGVAACLDAQGKTNDAISAYQGVIDRYPSDNVIPQAKLSLARLLEGQGKFKEAKNNLEDVARNFPGTVKSDAITHLEQLMTAHPELQPTNPPAMPPAELSPALKPATPVVKPPTAPQKH
ncbi:MAG TPA: tetratricopeptide repeat protein [Candidatus Polarisedimenticolia bacterium]|nr:tetratricopeptide repeat protein [Candidatus Polarisedimenticolia bacterium]